MWKKYVSFCVSVLFYCGNLFAQSAWMEWEEQVGEEENVVSWREQYEELSELAEHPLNINTVTKEELEQLPFLSDRLIEHILYYVYLKSATTRLYDTEAKIICIVSKKGAQCIECHHKDI